MNKFLEILTGLLGGSPLETLFNGVDKFVFTKEEKEEALNKLKELEFQKSKMTLEGQLALETLRVKVLEAEVEDKKSAREREVEVSKTDNVLGKLTPSLIALLMLILYAYSLVSYQYGLHVSERAEMSLHDIVMLIIGYYFGSSIGSQLKTKMLGDK